MLVGVHDRQLAVGRPVLSRKTLPSVLHLSQDLFSALEHGELVILGCPPGEVSGLWIDALLDSLEEIVLKRDNFAPIRIAGLDGQAETPGALIASALGEPATMPVMALLEDPGGSAALVLEVDCRGGISAAWRRLLGEIARTVRAGSAECGLRPLLVVLVACQDFPPLGPGPGLRIRALWNTVQSEDLRVLADSMLASKNENPFVRAWRVAVYSAAANQDPGRCEAFCRTMPNSIEQTIALAIGEPPPVRPGGDMPSMLSLPDTRWQVPRAVLKEWADGQITGYTHERGAVLDIERMNRGFAETYLRNKIWREQLSTLFSMVLDAGFSMTGAVSHAIGHDWLNGADAEVFAADGRITLEPAEIIERLEMRSDLQVPPSLWSGLRLLRRVRNELAHMHPVDYRQMHDLWRRYDQIRRKFG